MLLIVVAIAAYLAQDALRKYGFFSDEGESAAKRAAPADSPPPGGILGEKAESLLFSAPPSKVLDKARELETLMKKESAKRDGGY